MSDSSVIRYSYFKLLQKGTDCLIGAVPFSYYYEVTPMSLKHMKKVYYTFDSSGSCIDRNATIHFIQVGKKITQETIESRLLQIASKDIASPHECVGIEVNKDASYFMDYWEMKSHTPLWELKRIFRQNYYFRPFTNTCQLFFKQTTDTCITVTPIVPIHTFDLFYPDYPISRARDMTILS